ncbi:MAG: hypothetical protein HGGPFJEG_00154 [Ignavibacteria bacterium]|nr:hypothetical protein [Ignavibacteria bacterium]
MHGKKQTKKNHPDQKVQKKKKAAEDQEDDEEFENLKDEHELDEMLVDEMHGELSEEDDEEFIHKVAEFEKEHSKSKMKSVYIKLGKPKFTELKKLDPSKISEELKKLILLMDKHNIVVHSHGEYDDREKYRFITEEIFKEFVEDKPGNHITFIYEDYHPEMADDEDDEEY